MVGGAPLAAWDSRRSRAGVNKGVRTGAAAEAFLDYPRMWGAIQECRTQAGSTPPPCSPVIDRTDASARRHETGASRRRRPPTADAQSTAGHASHDEPAPPRRPP